MSKTFAFKLQLQRPPLEKCNNTKCSIFRVYLKAWRSLLIKSNYRCPGLWIPGKLWKKSRECLVSNLEKTGGKHNCIPPYIVLKGVTAFHSLIKIAIMLVENRLDFLSPNKHNNHEDLLTNLGKMHKKKRKEKKIEK